MVLANSHKGFPDIDNPSDALTKIEEQAHGTIPNASMPANGTVPPPPQPDSVNSLGFIAFNELFGESCIGGTL